MKSLAVSNFNLGTTIDSGQIFRWEKVDDFYYVTVGNSVLKIKQSGDRLLYECSNSRFDVENFLGLKNDGYAGIMESISASGKIVAAAVTAHSGLRLINQEPWECTASFICSSFSNIKRIRGNLNAIARVYGQKITLGDYSSHSFPAADVISKKSGLLKACGLGYREKYLAASSQRISKDFDFEKIRDSNYDAAKTQMMSLPGVGSKVADCILLFSLGFTEAFPVDVWMERIMKKHYLGSRKMAASKIADYGRQKFGKHAGYAQQFLYHYARKLNSN